MRDIGHDTMKKSPYIAQEFKELGSFIVDAFYVVNVLVQLSISIPLNGYYCFICICVRLILRSFISAVKILKARSDYLTVLELYDEISLVIISTDDFLSYSAFINVINGMAGLFWSTFTLVFVLEDDYKSWVCLSAAVFLYSCLLLMVLIPASTANQAAEDAKDVIISLPGWFPQHYKKLKIYVRKNFKQRKLNFTLWKIYTINKSLLISTLGTLVTYGFLVGTLGTIQNTQDVEIKT
ncbi:uncharacterized protein TNIN_466211 [Trichonephila inaurata madagascariensis]|uniref:Gustatory receptor n=1 Tax=Trichonephila inaurata madagascariensis TaxID=2747483 RepID=A0A8X6YB83_9ARAC|nr:uncharacterized protein TNIN_466211 [Trichonephila inaurata madagascariensis]